MTCISVRELLLRISNWASSSSMVSRVIIVGSQAAHTESDAPISGSDVDLVIYLRRDVDKDRAMQELAGISIAARILLHPLFISEEDRRMKESIREYKQMIESGKQVYP